MMCFDELLWKEPWLAPVIFNIKNRIATDKVDSVGVTPDGKTIYYNPKFWESMSPRKRVGVQLHEVLHIANMHSLRRGERDKELWNQACDMSINYLIKKSGYRLPFDALEGRNQSAENIYKEIYFEKECEKIENEFRVSEREIDSLGQSGIYFDDSYIDSLLLEKPALSGDLLDELLGDDNDMSETLEAIKESQVLASKNNTELSKGFKVTKSETNWPVILQSLVKSISGDDVDYLSYEFDELGICEDILIFKPKTKICALIDESGSVSDELYSMFLGELHKMSKWAEVFASGFTYDTPLNAVPLSKYERTMTGGTCVLRAYRDAEKSDFDNIIILTDGYLDFPKKEPKPTIWVMPKTHNRKQEVIIR